MENHRTTAIYSEAFQTYLAHTDEKRALLDALSGRLQALGATSLLDIGAGNGDLSIPLAKLVKRYVAVEQKPDYAKRLRSAGLEVMESEFPCHIDERFDAVLSSHSLPSYREGITGWAPFLTAARSLTNDSGHLLIVTFEDEDSEWNDLVVAAQLEEAQQRESRLRQLENYLTPFGIVEHEVIITHVRTETLTDMMRALAFVWSDGRAERLDIFMQNQKIAEHLETRYRDQSGYFFPFCHYLLDTHR